MRALRSPILRSLPIVLLIFLTGCGHIENEDIFDPDSGETHFAPSKWREVKSHYKAYLHGVLGTEWHLEHNDPQGIFKGSAKLATLAGGGSAGKLVRSLGTVSTAGTITGAYGSNGLAPSLTVTGIGLLKGQHRTGSLCVTFKGKAQPGDADQLFVGTFRVVGGTGRAARLHGSGNFVSLQPNVLKNYTATFSMNLAAGFKHASIGHAQGLSSACRNATNPPPPPGPKTLTATFVGWAFAAGGANTQSLPAGTTIYPDGATVTGAVGCGASDNLYWVIDYSGPSNALLTGYVLNSISVTPKQGRNLVFLGTGAPNGNLTSKGEVYAKGYTPVDLVPTLNLQRSC